MRFVRAGLQIVVVVATLVSSAPAQDQGPPEPPADTVIVIKSERKLLLLRDNVVIETFRVVFGSSPEGHKQVRGDGRTPEGRYVLDYKNPNSKFYKSIHISYPDAADRARAAKAGVDPGDHIMIHGQKNGWRWLSPLAQFVNWTDGCIALRDDDMDRVWQLIEAGTPIEIRP